MNFNGLSLKIVGVEGGQQAKIASQATIWEASAVIQISDVYGSCWDQGVCPAGHEK